MKNTKNIILSIPIAQAARFQELSDREKEVLTSFVTSLLTNSQFDMREIMDFIGFRAEKRGLTPEILEEILNEEPT